MKTIWIKFKKPALFILLIFFLGGFGGLFVQKYLSPYLSTLPFLERIGFLRPDTPIVITRTEQVRVNEGVRLIDLVKQVSPRVVTVLGGSGQVGQNFNESVRGGGVIVSSDGIIATDKSLLSDAKANFYVVTSDGKVMPASRLALDPSSSLAFLKIEANGLPASTFGLSSELEIAQQIILLAGSGNSVKYRTSYVSSAPGNESLANIYSSEKLIGNFSVDTGLQPGEALFNLSGQLVGLGSTDGLIPVETIKAAQDIYFAKKELTRPLIGLKYTVLTPVISSILGLGVSEGIYIREVSGPAKAAGLLAQDAVLKINNEDINNRQGLSIFINRANPNDEWKLTVLRQGSEREIILRLSSLK